MANILFIRLEGPLQSWGERGRWSIRDTTAEPTKSGVVGLLACALGLRLDADILQLARHIRMGVRVDQPGIFLDDYHTVGGGYSTPQLLTAEGKRKKTPGGEPHVEPSVRTYLCDASFLVAIQAEAGIIAQLAQAVQSPHWVFFLGRKSCPPSRPLYEGVGDYASIELALEDWPWYFPQAGEPHTAQRQAILEASTADGGIHRRHEIISRVHRTFGPYYTQEKLLTVQVIPSFPPFPSDTAGLQTTEVKQCCTYPN